MFKQDFLLDACDVHIVGDRFRKTVVVGENCAILTWARPIDGVEMRIPAYKSLSGIDRARILPHIYNTEAYDTEAIQKRTGSKMHRFNRFLPA